MNYEITEHRFRFAAWCAATAASASPNCRFAVKVGVNLLENAGTKKLAEGWNQLPHSVDFDAFHKETCENLIEAAHAMPVGSFKGRGGSGNFTYGVAAKMLNCFLKPLYVTGVEESISDENLKKRNAIHPPIDRLLLQQLVNKNVNKKKKFWRSSMNRGWSNFTYDEYMTVIAEIREAIVQEPIWKIEYYWIGFQGGAEK